ncbi:MAG: RsmB/NOP family class I SAM-dependent RNA methyltransferase [Burkholderiales bacterium]|nr:RsmB/NOP family class I SAM-dependent RNA methyltransferase [Burkholderiales bacterium]
MLDNKLVKELKILMNEVLQFRYPADKLLSNFFREHKKILSNERYVIAETIYSILRNFYKITAKVDKSELFDLIGVVWLYILQLDTDSYKNVNIIDFARLKSQSYKPDERLGELPSWIIELLLRHYTEKEVNEIMVALQSQAPLDLRVNLLKSDIKTVIQELKAEKIYPVKMKYSPYGIRLTDKVVLTKHKLFTQGELEVQDESSQLAGMLLNPKRGDMVVDFCAGSGGKTLLIGMLMRNTGRIYALDVNEKRLNNLAPRLARSGLSNVHTQLIAHENDSKIKRLHNKIDRVFVDAPCSGLGTLRRNPDLKFRQTLGTVRELNLKQSSILNSASKLLKTGGYMVYATCSILVEENQIIVDKFLIENPNFIKVKACNVLGIAELDREDGCLVLLPNINNTDGFFAALLQRIK